MQKILVAGFILLALTTSTWYPLGESRTVEAYARSFRFNFADWQTHAIWTQLLGNSLGVTGHLDIFQQRKMIDEYLNMVHTSRQLEHSIHKHYANPDAHSLVDEIKEIEQKLAQNERALFFHKRLAESILQYQIGQTIEILDMASTGAPFPPIMFSTTDLPKQLVISPRNVIRQDESISLKSDLIISDIIDLEERVESELGFSALVVNIGGVGSYPAMVIETTHLKGLIETVAHEWVHNYLALRPLGIRYTHSPDMRTINETTASIAGKEIGQMVIKLFYPDLLQNTPLAPDTVLASEKLSVRSQQEVVFDFSREMYNTRIRVDELLAKGKIEDAERYMEERRLFFWENGYAIRKLNQAYFAFHGAYADVPFSAAGRDVVGENVRLLRNRESSLAAFMMKISRVRSFEELYRMANTF